jgi:hypothetical protein
VAVVERKKEKGKRRKVKETKSQATKDSKKQTLKKKTIHETADKGEKILKTCGDNSKFGDLSSEEVGGTFCVVCSERSLI